MKTYQHTQSGKTLVNWMIVMFFVCAIGGAFVHPLIVASIIIAVTAWVFRSMTIEISETELIWCFGSGFLRKRVPISEVASVEPIRIKFWYGWGIHYTPRGLLYNVSGYDAVVITLRNGKQFCLGTDEPEELAKRLVGSIDPV